MTNGHGRSAWRERALAREANRPGWWAEYTRGHLSNRGFTGIETEALRELEVSVMYLPGLLQTEAYARAVFANGLEPRTEHLLENQVQLRMARQARLTDPNLPIELVAIIDESAFYKNVGGSEVMRDQLRNLVKCAALPTVTIQVLPNSTGGHVGMEGAFIILEFPQDDPDLLYVSIITKSLHIDHPEEVAEAKRLFSRLRSDALSPADSVAFIERVADQL